MSKKHHLPSLVVLLTLAVAAACAPAQPDRPTPTPPGIPPDLSGFEILVQYDFEPTFHRPELFYAFGRIPPFTLYADGTLVYTDEAEGPMGFLITRAKIVRLTPAEVSELMQQLTALGLLELESYTDMCQDQPDGSQLCIADAAFTIFRVRMPDASLREVKIYGGFAEDGAAFSAILELLNGYEHVGAVRYVPERSTIFVRSGSGMDGPVAPWPLEPAWLQPPGSAGEMWARVLEGEALETLHGAVAIETGDFLFESEGEVYSVYLVPWLPYADHEEALGEFEAYAPLP